MDLLAEARRVFDIEIDALEKTRDCLDATFSRILGSITSCRGKVVITGMGKPGHIATKLAATFSSLGTPSFYLHPAEARHGDLGMISADDVVIAISYSGESEEVIHIIPTIKLIGAELICITGNGSSTLARHSDIVQVLPQFGEACCLGLAPTSSTTAELCYGDALAVVASGIYGFNKADFAKFHPSGAIGKKLLTKVCDLMVTGAEVPSVRCGALLGNAISEMTQKSLGMVVVVDKNNYLQGIITDGDLRRCIDRRINIYTSVVDTIMTVSPKKIEKSGLAIDALNFLKKNNINNLPVTDKDNHLVGAITWQIIIKNGIAL